VDFFCNCCSSKDLDFHAIDENYISSDSTKYFHIAIDFYQCKKCFHISKISNPNLENQIDLIYRTYNINSQSVNTSEQKVLDSKGIFLSRSAHLINKLQEIQINLPKTSLILDFGCGGGVTLRQLREEGYKNLIGYDKYLDFKNVTDLTKEVKFFKKLSDLEVMVDSIFSIHTFEHLESLDEVFSAIKPLMKDKAILLIQVPYVYSNSLDLLILDHLHHFSKKSLASLAFKNGFDIRFAGNLINSKELTIVLKLATKPSLYDCSDEQPLNLAEIINKLNLRRKNLNKIKKYLDKYQQQIYIFGSSIAAAYCESYLKGSVYGFIDEDTSRHGMLFRRKLIHSPNKLIELPIIFPFEKEITENICFRNGLNIERVIRV
jgi:SAM-dependent methyltransferase